MNKKINLNFSDEEPKNITDKICSIIEEIGWRYDREGDKIQVAFKTDDDTQTDLITCVTDVLSDKIFVSSSIGIKSKCNNEVLMLLNHINAHKIFYGRFVLADDNTVWFDYTVKIEPKNITKDEIYRTFSIASNCSEHFCNSIIDVAVGAKTAYEVIETI